MSYNKVVPMGLRKLRTNALYIGQKNVFCKMQLSASVNIAFYKGRPDGTWIHNVFFGRRV